MVDGKVRICGVWWMGEFDEHKHSPRPPAQALNEKQLELFDGFLHLEGE
jgi:hypothetical protein